MYAVKVWLSGYAECPQWVIGVSNGLPVLGSNPSWRGSPARCRALMLWCLSLPTWPRYGRAQVVRVE